MEQTRTRNINTFIIGILLVGGGILTFTAQLFDWLEWNNLWPFIVIASGAAFFAGMFLGGKNASGLAVPGSIITGIGLILLVQQMSGWWETWSYAWALIIAAAGAGIAIHGEYGGSPERRQRGLALMRTGFTLFMVFGLFFEFFYSLINASTSSKIVWPALLVVFGITLLIIRIVGMVRDPEKQSNPNLFWPLFLAGAGLVFLFAGLGLLPTLRLLSLFNIWPVLLIVIGLQLIVRSISPWLGAGLGVVCLAGMLILAFFGPQLGLAQTPDWTNLLGRPSFFSANLTNINGTGEMVTDTRKVDNFDRVTLAVNSRLVITQGETPSLTIQAEENLMPYIVTRWAGSKLEILVKEGYELVPSEQILIEMTVQNLNELRIEHFGEVVIESLNTQDLLLATNGASNVVIGDLQADLLKIRIDGGGTTEVSGVAGSLDVENNGAGALLAEDLRCENIDIRIAGFGSATVWATDTLSVRIEGTGIVSYYGSPEIDREIAGLGIVQDMGAK